MGNENGPSLAMTRAVNAPIALVQLERQIGLAAGLSFTLSLVTGAAIIYAFWLMLATLVGGALNSTVWSMSNRLKPKSAVTSSP